MSKHLEAPIIAIPIGDPAGIGPEITVKTLNEKEIYDVSKPVAIGNEDVLKQAMAFSNVDLEIRRINKPGEGQFEHGTIDLIHLDNIDTDQFTFGKVSDMCGQAAYEYIKHAIELVQQNKAGSIATPPINKESLQAGEVPYIDHTAMLSAFTGVKDPLTMFEVRNLRIFFLTRHLSLKDAIGQMTKERVHDYLNRCNDSLKRLGLDKRKLAVAALNPHAGENGLFGSEEGDELTPGIELAKKDGVDAVGPVPADSVFHQAMNGKYDAVLSLYHDQGHIAAKMADFERTVSITNGMPFLRTSVDHGTAFDIAGKGVASAVSMIECVKAAAKYTPFFNHQ
jgi:4-hydroxythreonine-4-phosphate dehydrogenase